jgi:hypothetical protein
VPVKKKTAPKKKIVKKVIRKIQKPKPVKARVKKGSRDPGIKDSSGKAAKGKGGQVVGLITHYFPKVSAGVIKLKSPLAAGDKIRVKGNTTDFTQSVVSMQIDCKPIVSAKCGQEIGLLVNSRVRRKDVVFRAA